MDGTLLIVFIFIFLVLFFALRVVFLWYWRINDIVENQEKQTVILQNQFELLSKLAGVNPAFSAPAAIVDPVQAGQEKRAYALGSLMHQMEILNEKLASGEITDEEYQAAKRKLQGR